jgi:hypothetical protein
MKANMVRMTDRWNEHESFQVVHPLDDAPEAKVNTASLMPMRMTASVKLSLMALRGYLLLMTIMLLYHVSDLGGLFKHLK